MSESSLPFDGSGESSSSMGPEPGQGLPRRPSSSILRPQSRTDLASLGDDSDEQQMLRKAEDARKRASFSQQGPERFEFAPGSAPGGSRPPFPPSVTRRRPERPSLRSSGASQHSLTPSSASNLSETSSWTSDWSQKARRFFPCCIDRHKQRGPVATFLIRLLCCPYEPPPQTLRYMDNILGSWAYGIPFLFFTFLLLFGESIQYLWCRRQADIVFDCLYVIAFAFFVIDVAMRSYVSPAYLNFEFCGSDYRFDAEGRRRPRAAPGALKSGWGTFCGRSLFKIGSFMFWCDVTSTITLLYDISWINTALRSRVVVTVPVDGYGVPLSGGFLNESTPLEKNLALLVAIGRTARIARFIRATTIFKSSSYFFNCLWLPDWIFPGFWYHRCFAKEGQDSKSGTILEELAAAEAASSRRAPGRRMSSNIHVSSAAAIASINEEAERGFFKKVLGLVTCRPCRREMQETHEAATKIQKAWRISGNHMLSSVKTKSVAKSMMPSGVLKSQKGSNSSVGSNSGRKRAESQVGAAMRELTGQRVAVGIILSLIITVAFTYREYDDTSLRTMIMLHNQTTSSSNALSRNTAINAARNTSVPYLFMYQDAEGVSTCYNDNVDVDALRENEILEIIITPISGSNITMGDLSMENFTRDQALVRLLSTLFIILVWLFGVNSFSGPVMTLVVVPIERMVRLLSMLMRDPLGYQRSDRYKHFVTEEDAFLQNTRWSKDILKGMETSFLMSTILRIGSLMKVGFGAAGVEIIRESLEQQSQDPGNKNDGIFLNSKGSTVKCIFLFCDIRQFTDATESLQEEVFVFTNQIASVIHSICNSYGGSANKNIGDAFLMSWLLEDESQKKRKDRNSSFVNSFDPMITAENSECKADKALFSVVKICIALYYDQYYIETLNHDARERLLKKIGKRHGPVVQMGFGLHMGKAVQGAIGSERKLDATYISEAVEFAEFLESSTKQYGLKMLMSDAFYDLLDPANRRRCRKIDQLLIPDEEEESYLDDMELVEISEKIELYTYDMDVEALWREDTDRGISMSSHRSGVHRDELSGSQAGSEQSGEILFSPSRTGGAGSNIISRRMQGVKATGGLSMRNMGIGTGSTRPASGSTRPGMVRRTSLFRPGASKASDSSRDAASLLSSELKKSTSILDFDYGELNERGVPSLMPPLVLPPANAPYNPSMWNSKELRKIRMRFSDGLFFQKFNEGLQCYYSKDWDQAKRCFRAVLERVEDGPTRYFMNQMDQHGGVPPKNFIPYGRV